MIELEPCSHTVPLRGSDRPVSDFLDSVCGSKMCVGAMGVEIKKQKRTIKVFSEKWRDRQTHGWTVN